MTILILFQFEFVVADKGRRTAAKVRLRVCSFEAETEDVYACKGTKAAAVCCFKGRKTI